MRKGFTLLEVNLAILVMTTGVLIMCSLYSLGFRENRQSVEDVASVAFADTYLAPLVQGLSATNMAWSSWIRIGDTPSSSEMRLIVDGVWPKKGWMEYVSQAGSGTSYRINGSPKSTANGIFDKVMSLVPGEFAGKKPSLSSDYEYALVVARHGAVVQLAFRATRRKNALMAQSVFVSEVRFQGDPDK